MKRKKSKQKSSSKPMYRQGGELLNLLSTGSDIAMASGNPVAMLAGGGFKLAQGLTGNFGQQKKLEDEQMKLMREQQLMANQSRSMATISNFPLQGTTRAGVFRKYGGELYENGGQLGGSVQVSQGGQGMPLSSGGQLLIGDSHEEGGIQLNKGVGQLGEAEGMETISKLSNGKDYVGSASIVNPATGNLFSVDIAKAEMGKGSIESRASKRLGMKDALSKNLVSLKQKQIDGLAQSQEEVKKSMNQEQQSSMQVNDGQSLPQFQFGGGLQGEDGDAHTGETIGAFVNPIADLGLPAGNDLLGDGYYGLGAVGKYINPSPLTPTPTSRVGTPVTPDSPPAEPKPRDLFGGEAGSKKGLGLPVNALGTMALNSQLKTPPSKVLESSIQLPTVRQDARMAEIASNISGARKAMGRNRSQSQANATLASLVGAGSREANAVLQNVDAQNAQIRAQQAQANVAIQGRNVGNINQFRKETTQFDNQKMTNMLNAVNRDLLQGKIDVNAQSLEELQQTNNMIDLALSDPRIAKQMGLTEKELKALKAKALAKIANQ